MEDYKELTAELLHALEGAPSWYTAQWARLCARVRGQLWKDGCNPELAMPVDAVEHQAD